MLTREFGTASFGRLRVRTLIPATLLTSTQQYVVYDSGLPNTNSSIVDAVMASCAAPVLFPPYKMASGYYVADGALFAASPILALANLVLAAQSDGSATGAEKIISFGTGIPSPTDDALASLPRRGARDWVLGRKLEGPLTTKMIDASTDYQEAFVRNLLRGDVYIYNPSLSWTGRELGTLSDESFDYLESKVPEGEELDRICRFLFG
jgi:predicted acylesterase/phospholipase RssA